jgi:benzoate membrane transport protein
MARVPVAAILAGLAAFVWYAAGGVPLLLGVASQLELSAAQTSSWLCIVLVTGGLASIGLSLAFRQPIPITWSIPGLVYLGAQAGRFSAAEIAGASVIAGVLILVLGLTGLGQRLLAAVPLPIVLGMFAGGILSSLTGLAAAALHDAVVVGATVLAYFAARARRIAVPPVGLAILVGGIVVVVTGRSTAAWVPLAPPVLQVAELQFSPAAFVALGLPLVVLSAGIGSVQGLGFIAAQGYRVPVNTTNVVVGIASVINALFGGHQAIVARAGVAILAANAAGPLEGRYWGNLIAGGLMLPLALLATPVAALLTVVPPGYVATIAGLAILPAFEDALAKSVSGPLRLGAVVAFGVAAAPLTIVGITSAVWAIAAGLLVSLVAERVELLTYWRGGSVTAAR